MRYQLAPIHCRPWLLLGLSPKLLESHYENNYGGAMRRLNAITEKLESLDLASAPGYLVNSLKREQLIALNSTLLHELYFASLGGAQAATAAGNFSVASPTGPSRRPRAPRAAGSSGDRRSRKASPTQRRRVF